MSGSPKPNFLEALEPKQQDAIIELLSQPTIRKAADTVGISEKTMHVWLRQPAFASAYREARRQSFKQAMGLTQRYAPLAIQTLAQVMTDAKSTPASKVSAAEAILRFSRDSIELDDLEGRIESLETTAKATVGAPEPIDPAPAPAPLTPSPASPNEGDTTERRAAA